MFKDIHKQHIHKGRAQKGNRAENQMKERGSGLKTTCNEFMEPVLEIHFIVKNILPQCLMYTEEYTLTECSAESDSHSTGGKEGQSDPAFQSKKCSQAKALATRRRKLTQVEDLGQLATSFGQGLRALALT